jgi:hypothetical protein
MAATPFGLYASENRFADEDGDGVPWAATGRLAAYTGSQLSAMVEKIIAYEQGQFDDLVPDDWRHRVTLVGDNADGGGNFPLDSGELKTLIPQEAGQYQVEEIYLPENQARTRLIASIADGQRNMSYIGHGTDVQWAAEGLLSTDDIPAMSNGPKLPVVTALTCEVGRFELPGGDSLSEALVAHPPGGAAGVISPSGLSLNSQAKILNEALFTAFFQDGETVIGDAFLQALEDYRDAEGSLRFMLDIYNCACDPATVMPPLP